MKKFLNLFIGAALFGSLFAKQLESLKVGITPYPNADILEFIKPELKKAGYELQIVEFNDYVLPNLALEDGQIDLNQFQTLPYLIEFNERKSTNLIAAGGVFVVPMGLYSNHKSLDAIPKGGLVYVPNDPVNESRALDVLESSGLIKVDKNIELRTALDIVDNPLNLVIKELEAAQLPRVLSEADLVAINTNYALAAGLNPREDAIFLEHKDSQHINVVAARKGEENSPKTKAYLKALQTPEVAKMLEEKFKGAVIPNFSPLKY